MQSAIKNITVRKVTVRRYASLVRETFGSSAYVTELYTFRFPAFLSYSIRIGCLSFDSFNEFQPNDKSTRCRPHNLRNNVNEIGTSKEYMIVALLSNTCENLVELHNVSFSVQKSHVRSHMGHIIVSIEHISSV